jgi:hypothetical protein
MWISANGKCYFPDCDLEQIKLDYLVIIDELGLLWVRDKKSYEFINVFCHFSFGDKRGVK